MWFLIRLIVAMSPVVLLLLSHVLHFFYTSCFISCVWHVSEVATSVLQNVKQLNPWFLLDHVTVPHVFVFYPWTVLLLLWKSTFYSLECYFSLFTKHITYAIFFIAEWSRAIWLLYLYVSLFHCLSICSPVFYVMTFIKWTGFCETKLCIYFKIVSHYV